VSHRDELRGSFKSLLSLSLAEGFVVPGARSFVIVEILLTRCPLAKISLAVLLDRMTAMAAQDGTRIERAPVERVADVKSLLGRHVPQTRQLLRKRIPGRIVCTPFHDARGQGYKISGGGDLCGLTERKTDG